MGNSLAGSAPQAIHPIEYYLSDVGEFQFVCSLGSTRFFKVAKCRHYEGECVVKVLALEDPSLPLATHKQRIELLSSQTARNVSIAAFHRAAINSNFALIARQYVRHSLYDRLSTRPFLTVVEKCWLAFQLIKCMSWCHQRGIHHGDIKLDNILITSSLWLVITDFATYKPVFLPDDNPSDFSYFFDTSRRRCCNIAPERFVSDCSGLQSDVLNAISNQSTEPQLTSQMDMFSVGCVLAELFSDDTPNGNLFDLADLLTFRQNQFFPDKALNSISNEKIRSLVVNLISLDPKQRKLSEQILTELSGSVFPQYFEYLYEYLRQLIRLPPDAKIMKLSQDMSPLIDSILADDHHGLLILLVVITSTMRGLKHIHCKILGQRLACRIAESSPVMSAFITDRLLPYLLSSLSDTDARVRAEAINSIAVSLEQVVDLPQSDNNVFTDYILPALCQVVTDRSTFVRLTLAANISRLSKVALNFLNQSCDQNYDEELSLLHDSFQMIVSQLLTDSNNCVRRTLLLTPQSCANLCVFFGRHKTNEVILSHIITFLNDKTDFQLRASFFDNIIVIASYLGSQCSPILQPLLQQGLSDAEEMIVYKTIISLSSLVEQGLLNKSIIFELVREALPLLAHPNLWITNAMIALILTLSSRLSLADINCKIKPLVEPNLGRNVHSLRNSALIRDSIHPAIPRSILELILSSKLNIDRLFECLTQRKALRTIPRHHQSTIVFEDALYTRLTHEGMTDQIEDQLVCLSDLIKKIHKSRKNLNQRKTYGNVTLNRNKPNRRCFSVTLREQNLEKTINKRQTSTMNEEWLHMFGSNTKLISSNDEDVEGGDSVIPVATEAREYDPSHIQCPPCHREVKRLIQHKKNDYNPLVILKSNYSTPFKPKGVLVAHLHEHEAAVRRVLRIGDSSLFATSSTDGTVRVWDASKMEGHSVLNRSRLNFIAQSSLNPQAIGGMTYCKDLIICYTNTNIVHILEMNASSSRMKLLNTFQVTPDIAGSTITDITSLNANTFAISLSDSSILLYDFRTLQTNANSEVKPFWKLNIAAHERLITSIDGNDYVLFCGTSRGLLITFDLRFLLRSNTSSYPTQNRIRRIKYTPEGLYSSAEGNCEVTLWDCETGSRIKTLWASTAPALSLTQASTHSVLGMHVTNTGKESSIITAGTDMRIRLWDTTTPERSYIISDNAKSNSSVKYVAKFIEGIQVIQECQESPATASHNSSWDQQVVSPSHRDCITDVARVNHLLVSASCDGVVKVWK